MSSKFEPPKFMDDASGYPEYKKLLLRWSRITKTPKEQQAEVVLYHLQGHPSGVQEKIDTALGPAVVNQDDGLAKLIEYLDAIYAEDPMSEAWSKYPGGGTPYIQGVFFIASEIKIVIDFEVLMQLS